ncbi:hypothetical protein Plav_0428 [Parvibaculum lavamentivorans DS-1]|uniref:Uncharacterized protein n=1 Tax=Parvibaculum lavamentivorans (strain DS-1 / DSM 13023 / NCIMB 13966) TaxID=402881 RepID=A7HQ68_PARL1|nr:hypothetical protein [Parvibaculum lavamentivorans]ABS62051.1 hypothetical protein Plav_0428 [Parvibaculum lavamentivorans DS-1]
MPGRFGSSGFCLLLLAWPVAALAQGAEIGGIGSIAVDAAAVADEQRARVTGDETFQGGFTCRAPSGPGGTGPILCESQVNPVLPAFQFSLSWHLDRETGDRVIDSIAIRHAGKAEPFQIIDDAGSRAMTQVDNNGFETIDANFDGYLDFRLIAETAAGPNVPYRNWLWSEEESRFVENAGLNEIVSAEFDPETQEILSRWRSSAAEGGVDVYTWDDLTPVLIHREADKYNGPADCTRSFFDLIGGELTKTGEAACT